MSIKTYKASEIVIQYAKLDADPDFIRVADIPVEALESALFDAEKEDSSLTWREYEQLRALLAAVTGGNNEGI
jgi:hypothetical protein